MGRGKLGTPDGNEIAAFIEHFSEFVQSPGDSVVTPVECFTLRELAMEIAKIKWGNNVPIKVIVVEEG